MSLAPPGLGPAALRADAEGLAGPLPALLADAEHLAQAVVLGEHGRRRAGAGADFWQYRAAQRGDDSRRIDWRRSARSDATFIQDKEWQTAQTVAVWADRGRSMAFASAPTLPTKGHRARLLALAAAVLLVRGGERVGLSGDDSLPPRRGAIQLPRLAERLAREAPEDYAAPDLAAMPPRSRALLASDFLGDVEPVVAAVTAASDRGIRGALLQVLDPQEEGFPFQGRTIFESIGGTLRHETLKAGDLRARYLDRLHARKARLRDLARATGWQVTTHLTSAPAAAALLWTYAALERRS